MTDRCPTCKRALPRTPAQQRAVTKAKESAFTPGRCHACKVPTLTGWTEAQLWILDARPLNQIGELAASALGLPTFARKDDRFVHRSAIARRDFPDRPVTVHVIHRCTQQWPEALRLPLNGKAKQSNTSTNENNEPPF